MTDVALPSVCVCFVQCTDNGTIEGFLKHAVMFCTRLLLCFEEFRSFPHNALGKTSGSETQNATLLNGYEGVRPLRRPWADFAS
jgi:hypothetical protein